jgi:hypothetical protein
MLSVLIGIAVVIVSVFCWLGHLTVNHALAVLIFIAGVSIILGALSGDRGGKYTRL